MDHLEGLGGRNVMPGHKGSGLTRQACAGKRVNTFDKTHPVQGEFCVRVSFRVSFNCRR